MTDRRLVSLDALRGADMLLLMGVGPLVAALFGADSWLARQFSHVAWNGLRVEDMIFPVFLFVAGVSFPYSCAKQLAAGRTRLQVSLRVLRRGAVLFLLGLVYDGLLQFKPAELVWGSVLGRIGIAWTLAALAQVWLGRRARAVLAVAILLGYWAVMRGIAAPDHPTAFPLSPEGNLSGWLDRTLLPGRLTVPGLYSNQGTLSTLPAVVTAQLGMFAGDFVKSTALSGTRRTLALLAGGSALAALGLFVAYGCGDWSFPLNKKLWSPSFVLVVGGISAVLFAAFHWLCDVRGWTSWAFPLRVVGVNSITIYLAMAIVPFGAIRDFFVAPCLGPVASALGYVAVCWLFLYFLYRQNVFLKV